MAQREPCPLDGHYPHAATHCPECRAVWLATRRWPDGTQHKDATQIAVNTRGAAAVRRALTTSQEDR